jgi:hypothetical protein
MKRAAMKYILMSFLFVGISCCAFAQNSIVAPLTSTKANVELKNKKIAASDLETLSKISLDSRSPDDSYKIGKLNLTCIISEGTQVGVIIVDDVADFYFLAVRSAYGPAILANENRTADVSREYLVFSFYKECGMHALTNINIASIDEAADYAPYLLEAAECLAVIPTLQALNISTSSLNLRKISALLQDEYGHPASSANELERCAAQRYAAEKAEKVKAMK